MNHAYQKIIPLTLTIVKHLNNNLVAFLKYESSTYGINSPSRFCTLNILKENFEWKIQFDKATQEPMFEFESFIETLLAQTIEKTKINFEEMEKTLSIFEKKEIEYRNIEFSFSEIGYLSENTKKAA